MAARRKFGNILTRPCDGGVRAYARYKSDGNWRNAPDSFLGRTKELAEKKAGEWLDEQEALLNRSRDAREELTADNTLNEWIDLFLKMPRKKRKRTAQGTTSKKAQNTVNSYESPLRLHVRPFLGDMRIGDITLQTVINFQGICEDRLEEKPRTNEKAQDYTRWVLNLAVELEAIRRNPYAHPTITMPDGSVRREPVPLEEDDVDALTEAMPVHYRRVPMLTAYTGMRAGELWALRRRSVNLLRKELYVTASVGEIKGRGLVMGPPKNGKPRTIALSDPLVQLLKEHMTETGGGPDDWLFRTVRGKQVRHTNFMEDVFKQARIDAKLPERLVFHDLRHFCAHYHISHGFNEYRIMELLGHSSITVTMNIYGGLFASARREMADRVSQIMAERAVRKEHAGVSKVCDVVSLESGAIGPELDSSEKKATVAS